MNAYALQSEFAEHSGKQGEASAASIIIGNQFTTGIRG